MQVVHRGRGQPGLESVGVEALQVLRRELGERELAEHRDRVQPDVLLVAHPGALAEGGADPGEPAGEEMAHGLALDHQCQSVGAGLQRGREAL